MSSMIQIIRLGILKDQSFSLLILHEVNSEIKAYRRSTSGRYFTLHLHRFSCIQTFNRFKLEHFSHEHSNLIFELILDENEIFRKSEELNPFDILNLLKGVVGHHFVRSISSINKPFSGRRFRKGDLVNYPYIIEAPSCLILILSGCIFEVKIPSLQIRTLNLIEIDQEERVIFIALYYGFIRLIVLEGYNLAYFIEQISACCKLELKNILDLIIVSLHFS